MRTSTKFKILNVLLILTSLIGFLQWGAGNSLFLFQAEAEIFAKMIENPMSILHPLTVLPFAGQLLLLYTLFQRVPGKIVTYVGLSSIGILLLLMFFIGCIELNFKILISTMPFLATGIVTIWSHRKKVTD